MTLSHSRIRIGAVRRLTIKAINASFLHDELATVAIWRHRAGKWRFALSWTFTFAARHRQKAGRAGVAYVAGQAVKCLARSLVRTPPQ
jgi:hypothetical protein